MAQRSGMLDEHAGSIPERITRHHGNADVMRQDLASELGVVASLRTVERRVSPVVQTHGGYVGDGGGSRRRRTGSYRSTSASAGSHWRTGRSTRSCCSWRRSAMRCTPAWSGAVEPNAKKRPAAEAGRSFIQARIHTLGLVGSRVGVG